MNRSRNTWLIIILLLVAFSLWIDLSKNLLIINPFSQQTLIDRNVDVKLGLDLRGGLQTLLEADVPADRVVTGEELTNARNILENRANGLGVSEVVMQTAGDRRIVAEFPGIRNPEEVVASLKQTALLEFVDMGDSPVAPGTKIQTDFAQSSAGTSGVPSSTATAAATSTPAATATAEAAATPAAGAAPTAQPPATVYHTVMTGASLDTAAVQSQSGQYVVAFTLKPDAKQIFSDYTTQNKGKYLAIVLDNTVLEAPRIDTVIADHGRVTGAAKFQDAADLALNLRSGSLPAGVRFLEERIVGPSLGSDSIHRGIFAGLVGLALVQAVLDALPAPGDTHQEQDEETASEVHGQLLTPGSAVPA